MPVQISLLANVTAKELASAGEIEATLEEPGPQQVGVRERSPNTVLS